MEEVTVGSEGEGAPESKDDGHRAGRIAAGVGAAVIIALILWLLWPRFGVVPNVIGMRDEAARAVIDKAGYVVGRVGTRTVDTTEAGRVLAQMPPPGMRVSLGQEVDFTVAEPSGALGQTGLPPATEVSTAETGVVVPAVTGQDQGQAQARLQIVGLTWAVDFQQSGMPVGQVIHQAPSAGVVVPGNTVVKLTLSSGAGSRGSASVGWSGAVIPDVLGMTTSGARSKLAGSGFGMRAVYGYSTTTRRGYIFWQSAGPGPDTRSPSTIEVWVSIGVPTRGAPYPKPPDQAPF